MNNGVIFQYYEGKLHGEMIDVFRKTHEMYARVHSLDYIVREMHGAPINAAWGWVRWSMMLDLFRSGYEYVIHVEDDAVLEDFTTDVRDAVRDKPLAMTFGGDPLHYQCGVIYARRTPQVMEFIGDVMRELPPPDDREETSTPWWERTHCQQTTVLELLRSPKYAGLCEKLPLKWNNALWHPQHQEWYKGDDAHVRIICRAWHGIMGERNKLDSMRAYADAQGAGPCEVRPS